MLTAGVDARVARADALPVTLEWDAPAECPTQAEVLGELSRITRVKPGRVVTPIHARAQIDRTSNKYRLHLRTEREDQTGDTDLDASDCGVLKRGVTLVLALALGDGVDVMDEKPEDAPPATPERAPRQAPAPPPPPPRPRRDSPMNSAKTDTLAFVPALSGTIASGFLGKAAFGAQLSLTGETRHFAAFAEASAWPEQTTAHVQGVAAQLEALSGALGACARDPLGALALSACARFTLGAIHARSEGAFRNGASTAPYFALGPALVLTAPLAGKVQLRAEAALDIALAPPQFEEQNFGRIYAVSSVIPLLSLGLAWGRER